MFSIPILFRSSLTVVVLAGAGCAGAPAQFEATAAPQVFYTVTAEIALSRHEARIAALQYAAAAESGSDVELLRRAVEVATLTLQPTVAEELAAHWLRVAPESLDARRAAAAAALELHRIDAAASQCLYVLQHSPAGEEAEFARLETELSDTDNTYGARQLADRLAAVYRRSVPALRLQAVAALRADDPAAAASGFAAALDLAPQAARQPLLQGGGRARILSGDADEPLARSKALLEGEDSSENRLQYALLLLAAQRTSAATLELDQLARQPDAGPVALRLLALLDFQQGNLADAAVRFTQLASSGKFADDAMYYLGVIAERHADFQRALRLYAQVQRGDNVVPALLRAATLLHSHGAAPAAEALLDQLLIDEPQRAPGILASRARIYADHGEVRRALELLDQSELEYPDSVELRYARASTYEAQGNVREALRELRDVTRLRPNDPAALNAFGYTLADHRRQLRKARALIERAHVESPKSPAILDSLGWVLYRQGHADEALPHLAAAYADDRGGDIAAHFGEVLWQLGQRDEAERIWSEASGIDGDNRTLNATRQRLQTGN